MRLSQKKASPGLAPLPKFFGAALLLPLLLSGCEKASNVASDIAGDRFKSQAQVQAEKACVQALSEAENKRGFTMRQPAQDVRGEQSAKNFYQIHVSYNRKLSASDGTSAPPWVFTQSVCETQEAQILEIQLGMTPDDWDRELKAVAERNQKALEEKEKPKVAQAPNPLLMPEQEKPQAPVQLEKPVADPVMLSKVTAVMTEVRERYAELDSQSDKFSQKLYLSMLEQQKTYIEQGRPADNALRLAAYDTAKAAGLSARVRPGTAKGAAEPVRTLPTNAHWVLDGQTWSCNAGFAESQANRTCTALQIPPNGVLDPSGRSWRCQSGYNQHGNECFPAPGSADNATNRNSNALRCGPGFKATDGRCEALPPPPEHATYDLGSENWHCVTGYYLVKGRCVSDGTR